MRKYARHQVQDLNKPYRAVGTGGDEWLQPRQYFWGRGQPNNRHKEDCLEMKDDGTWHDQECTDKLHFICQFAV